MTPDWNEKALEEKLNEAKEFIERVIDRIERNPDACFFAYRSIVSSAVENFFDHLEKSEDIENCILDLHYNVNIDKNLNREDFTIEEKDARDEDTFNRKILSIFIYLHNVFLFDALSKDTVILKQDNKYKYLINSTQIQNKIARIGSPERKLKKIIELTYKKIYFPFSINKYDQQNSTLSGKIALEFAPLKIDALNQTGYYTITVSLDLEQNLNSLEEKRQVVERLRELFRKETVNDKTEYSENPGDFIEIDFTGKLLVKKSLQPNFIAGNVLQISADNFPIEDIPQKKLVFNKPPVKLSEEEEKVLALYAKEGVENYAKIAKLIFCSEQTVKNRAQSIQLKLAANNMAHAAYLYYAGLN